MTEPILALIARFSDHLEEYKSSHYNETQLRRDFLDPFLRELGWDIDNTSGYAETYRDVVHEERLRVGGALAAPDYGFRIGGQRKFFLEAKKPSVVIKNEIKAAYQLRRYAWSAKLPLSILSDFEEFAIYDTRIKPSPTDPASKARVFYCRFDEYPQHWDHIAGIFSREAILKGSFDRFAATTKTKRGTAEVDADFLATIEGWRVDLARNLALRNPAITQRELNFAVQRIIDRIIFLRICEDRGIEDYRRLERATEGKNVHAALTKLFREADDRYNSGLFHFRAEKGRPHEPDALTPHLAVDDELLRRLIRGLYFPDSPYEFSVLGADILGQVYEQFLGCVIELTKGHTATVTEKPEVKKAGGVFYTPSFIVEHIVQRALAPLLDGKSPKQIAKLRVLDPACGSGSFLIVVYQHLLDWHHRWYTASSPEKWARGKQPVLVAVAGGFVLSIRERKRILTTHVFGVDIDAQAVEVTKLSLLLKVLEGETAQTMQPALIHDRVLPDLADNIKCGNSLIGTDFHGQGELLDDDEQLRINAFDWEAEAGFPEIMRNGGFDVVVGNPPYVRIQTLSPPEVAHLTKRYASAATGNCDLYVSFVEKAYGLLRRGGRLGFILPNKFFRTDYGVGLRRLLSADKALSEIVDFGHEQVFKATIYTCIVLATRSPQATLRFTECGASSVALESAEYRSIAADELTAEPWTFQPPVERRLLEKLRAQGVRLLELPVDISRGSSTGCDDVFLVSAGEHDLEDEALRDPVFATDFGRYEFRPKGTKKVIFPYGMVKGEARLLEENELRTRWPKTYRYLKQHEGALRSRKQLKQWYGYSAARSLRLHQRAHLIVPLLADRGLLALLPEARRGALCPMAGGGFTITVHEGAFRSPLYVLGLLNSKLLFWCLRAASNVFRGGWITCTKQYVGELPIRNIDPKNAKDVGTYERIVALVTKMLALHERRGAARTPHEQTTLDRRIAALDQQIDDEVYALYGLDDDEIALVEAGTLR